MKGASAVRIGIAIAALVYMYWDLRDSKGSLSLKEIERKKQLTGVLAIMVAAPLFADSSLIGSCLRFERHKAAPQELHPP